MPALVSSRSFLTSAAEKLAMVLLPRSSVWVFGMFWRCRVDAMALCRPVNDSTAAPGGRGRRCSVAKLDPDLGPVGASGLIVALGLGVHDARGLGGLGRLDPEPRMGTDITR